MGITCTLTLQNDIHGVCMGALCVLLCTVSNSRVGGKVSHYGNLLHQVGEVLAILVTFAVLSFASAILLIAGYSK